ncbi:CAP domain-containing protein [Chitinophaga sp.]|uniref:CAP domain-containing protein n=1 Tax=Chitinophaga sp. TaxID=1869181 RepID=UPI00262CEEA6|nr:CAP domain-containing protein [uncultured Chitinophaga sp.]
MLPKTVRFIPVFATVCLLMASCAKENPVQPVPAGPEKPGEPPTAVVIENKANKDVALQLVNNARAKGCQCGDTWMPPVSPVTWNVLLELAAVKHSKDMLDRKYFSHNSPGGATPSQRITAEGYNYNWWGENIATGPQSEADVVNGWLNSPGHCKNLMSANFREMGVGRTGNLWTQVFAAPAGR